MSSLTHAVLVALPQPLHVIDRQLRLAMFNPALANWCADWKAGQPALGRKLFDLFPCLGPTIRHEYEQVFATGASLQTIERMVIDGRSYVGQVHKILLEGNAADPHVLTVVHDITEAEQARQALAQNEHKYRLLVEHQTDFVVQIDREGRFLFASPSYCNLVGKDEAELIGQACQPLVHEDDRDATEAAMEALLRPPYTCYVEHRVWTTRGWRWLAWKGCGLLSDHGHVESLMGSGRDITDRKEAEAQLRQKQNELAHAARLTTLGELASSLTHELNQPLSAIKMLAQAGLRQLHNPQVDPARLTNLLQQVADQSERAGEIVRHTRSFARKRKTQKQPCPLNDILDRAVAFVRDDATRRGVELAFEPGPPQLNVLVDAVQIEQVVINMVLNAGDAMAEAQSPARRVTIATEPIDDDMVKVVVRDTGPGLDPEVRRHLFESFYSTKPDGLGIGLSLCRNIVEAHGGRIWAENHPEGGAVLSFTLPQASRVRPA